MQLTTSGGRNIVQDSEKEVKSPIRTPPQDIGFEREAAASVESVAKKQSRASAGRHPAVGPTLAVQCHGMPLLNPSPLGGQERIGVYTTLLPEGSLFL